MKNALGATLVTLALVGCTSTPTGKVTQENTSSNNAVETQVIHFTGPMDLTIELKSSDNFETAMMTDNSDRTFMLKSAPAASGMFMTDGKGVSIHIKGSEGIVEFVKDKPIQITEFKK